MHGQQHDKLNSGGELMEIRMDQAPDEILPFDPFMQQYDDIKSFNGLDSNFKRRQTRLQKSFTGVEGARSLRVDEVYYSVGYGIFDVVEPPFNLTQLAQYYDQSGAHHSAVNIKVSNVVGLGYGFEATPKTIVKLEDIEDEDQLNRAQRKIERLKIALDEWLDSLNEEDTFTAILEKVMTDYETTGNGYIEVGRTITGEIGYLGHIPSSTMRVRRLRDGFVQLAGSQVVFFRNFRSTDPNPITINYRPNEVIHIKKYSPNDGYYGIPDILSASSSLVGNFNAQKFNMDFFQHKAVPRNLVIVKNAKLSPDSEDKLFAFLQGLKGQHHRTLYIPLKSDDPDKQIDFNIIPVEADITDMSFDKYQQTNNQEIFMTHNTPIIKSGSMTSQTSIASALQTDRTFNEQYVRPTQRKIVKRINQIISEQTDVVKLKFNEMTLLDESTLSQIEERYLRWDVITPNEVRSVHGKPSRSGGDDTVGVMSQLEVQGKQAAAQQTKALANQSRQRDAERAAANPDDPASPATRNPKGESRQQQ